MILWGFENKETDRVSAAALALLVQASRYRDRIVVRRHDISISISISSISRQLEF